MSQITGGEAVNEAVALLSRSTKRVIIAGGGVIASGACIPPAAVSASDCR